MERFEAFCGNIQKMLAEEKTVFRKIENGRALVSELTSRQDWFFDYLKKMILEPGPAEIQKPGIWSNEFTLYRSPDKSFVVLAYIWDAKLADIVHDHGSWGIIGTLLARLGEKKFARLDDGRQEGFADIRETARGVFGPGEATFVLPLNEGLHAMDNPTDGIAVSINVYGKTIGRGYVQFFDPEKKTVTRVFPPRTLKEVLAVKTLAAIDPSRAEGVLREALGTSRPPQLKQEYEAALAKIRGK
jgi:predicted metal-dependent enzyme (double-stranded beta helix superfamily)